MIYICSFRYLLYTHIYTHIYKYIYFRIKKINMFSKFIQKQLNINCFMRIRQHNVQNIVQMNIYTYFFKYFHTHIHNIYIQYMDFSIKMINNSSNVHKKLFCIVFYGKHAIYVQNLQNKHRYIIFYTFIHIYI